MIHYDRIGSWMRDDVFLDNGIWFKVADRGNRTAHFSHFLYAVDDERKVCWKKMSEKCWCKFSSEESTVLTKLCIFNKKKPFVNRNVTHLLCYLYNDTSTLLSVLLYSLCIICIQCSSELWNKCVKML